MSADRKLATILAADVVGYSRMMGADEEGTVAALKSARKITDKLIAQHGGRIFATGGDSVLAEFTSAVEAVRCAVEIQEELAARNTELPEPQRMVFRIGINVGDVIIDGDDLLGDGVNVAARLEGIADPGGICISDSVYQQVKAKLTFPFRDLGPQSVKNIAEPVRVYAVEMGAVSGASAPAPPAKTTRMTPAMAMAAVVIVAVISAFVGQTSRPPTVEAAVVADMAFALPDKPSIAVLAFVNLGTNADDEFLADSFSEDILTSLSKLSGLFVISRTTSFTYKGTNATTKQIAEDLGIRYVLEGSFQRDGDRIRVTAQLIDAIGGQHVWADRYDRDLDDLFAVKDEITLAIVSNISAELLEGGRDRVLGRETDSLEAWLLVKQGIAELLKLDRESLVLAKDLFERALAIDPGFVTAVAGLGQVYRFEGQLGYTDTPQASFDKALEFLDRALELDPNHALANGTMAGYYGVVGPNDLALEFGQRAVDLDPNDYLTHGVFGRALTSAGRPDDALRELRLALRLSPESPLYLSLFLANALNYAGLYEEGAVVAEKVLARPDLSTVNEWAARAYLTVALDGLGREEEARAELALMIELVPALSTIKSREAAFRRRYVDEKYTDDRIAVWRRLGMPEE